MSFYENSEHERERMYFQELTRPLSETEREYLNAELRESEQHHMRMKEIVDSMPELETKPVLFLDATDRGTVGSDFFTELNPELLNFLNKIQTGQPFPERKSQFDYRQFAGKTFGYMFGFEPDDKRFKLFRTIDPETRLPENLDDYSLVIGSGGEINYLHTQAQYLEQLTKLKSFMNILLDSGKPFFMTCATHQILGQAVHERAGNDSMIIADLKDQEGQPLTESGIIDLFKTGPGQQDEFTKNLPEQFSIMSNHGQYLTEVPPGAVTLAGNKFNGVPIETQLLSYQNGLGIQGHPEFDPVVMIARLILNRSLDVLKGKQVGKFPEPDPRNTYTAREVLFPEFMQFAHKLIANKET